MAAQSTEIGPLIDNLKAAINWTSDPMPPDALTDKIRRTRRIL